MDQGRPDSGAAGASQQGDRVKIGVLGGGPAGLYLALLAKRADPSHEITVVERNAPDATFGWGVVFSEETLGALRDADHPSYLEITDTFARWSAIDVVYGGRTVRSGGHVFSAIARRRLLGILQRRCREVGVELVFQREVPDLDTSFASHDLVVAADGVNSTARRQLEPHLRPTLDVHRSKFVWFGSDLPLDAFTFVFRTTPHGMFQVHAYPFDADTSTFIVECTEGTWRAAGLDQASESESIAFCQELFAPELGGHKLLSNRSLWTSFVTVRCQSWHHGNVVLLGDAAHTAHFTIGSGTKLAMEDAVALGQALASHPADLEAAFTDYELERQPVVERFQEAARESATWFENVRRYDGFDPVQFACNLLTRSGRIGHLELTRRDPAFAAAVDRRFAGRDGLLLAPPPLFAPLDQRAVTLANRVVLTGVGEDDADGGHLPAEAVTRLEAAAAAGAGAVVGELVAVAPGGRVTPGTPGLWADDQVGPWAEAARAVEERGSTLVLRLGHAGRRGATRPRRAGVDRPLPAGGWPLLAASAIPYTPAGQVPTAMSPADMERVVREFAAAAHRAAAAGVRVLLLDLAHGYLLGGFLSPLANRRDDEFGGPLEARLRFPLQVVAAVRDAWPGDRPLWAAMTATDWAPGGLEPDEAVAVARSLAANGCDLLQVTAGQTTATSRPDYGRFHLVGWGDLVRNSAAVPTMVGGGLTTADQVNTVLAAGRADLCLLDPRTYAAPATVAGVPHR
jgi:anthraniloyl-CoA monooxygenase